ncbi:50S ribosomal protein L31e [archaeon]|nr:50S ribosomal protein L31e [archaeon]
MTERTYVIPLRKEWLKVSRYKRAKRAVTGVRRFLKRHFRVPVENVKVGKSLNEEIWKHGIRNPPSRVKVTAVKDAEGVVRAELFGHKFEQPKEEAKAEKPKKEEPRKEEPKAEKKPVKKETAAEEKPKAAKPKKEEKSVEEKVKEVVKQKNKDPAVKKGEAKIQAELNKLDQQTVQASAE